MQRADSVGVGKRYTCGLPDRLCPLSWTTLTRVSMPPTELTLSELPARTLLEKLGYTYIPADQLAAFRDSERDAIRASRLVTALRKLNAWLSLDSAKTPLESAALRVAGQRKGGRDSGTTGHPRVFSRQHPSC